MCSIKTHEAFRITHGKNEEVRPVFTIHEEKNLKPQREVKA